MNEALISGQDCGLINITNNLESLPVRARLYEQQKAFDSITYVRCKILQRI